MPIIQKVNEITLVAAGDMSSNKHKAGVYTAGGKVTLAGAGVYPDVIIMDTPPNTDDHVNCIHVPTSMRVAVLLSGTVSDGSKLTTASGGTFIEGTSGDKFCLVAEEGGATGEIVQALKVAADTIG